MKKLDIVKTNLTKMTGRTGLKIKKYSPEILMGAGVVGVIGTTVLACKATLKIDGLIDGAKYNLDRINDVSSRRDEFPGYTLEDAKKDKALVYIQTGASLLKMYGPAIALGTASIGCLIGSHNIMKKRNVAVVAAYKAVEESFKGYRQRVVSEFGAEKDQEFRYGMMKEEQTVEEKDKNGKTKKTKKTVDILDPNHKSQYARFFDDGSKNWSKTSEYNMLFLKAQQNYANDLLKARGHIFLNEVYDMLGIPRSQEGSVVGWVLGNDSDNFVDFGMYDTTDVGARDFVNGYEASILLDFNVDGVIYDLI